MVPYQYWFDHWCCCQYFGKIVGPLSPECFLSTALEELAPRGKLQVLQPQTHTNKTLFDMKLASHNFMLEHGLLLISPHNRYDMCVTVSLVDTENLSMLLPIAMDYYFYLFMYHF